MKMYRASFKWAFKFCSLSEEEMRADVMARSYNYNSFHDFYKEAIKVNSSRAILSDNIERHMRKGKLSGPIISKMSLIVAET